VNHYPLLKKAIEKGDIISVTAEKPKLHSGEDTRWDFKVILVFKNEKLAFGPNLTKQYEKQLYPDPGKLKKDE
jgi:quercetin dioxygenase-like cupin family protein